MDDSSNDENVENQQQKLTAHQSTPMLAAQRKFENETKQQFFIQTQNQKINEKMLDNQKLLLESLSSLPQNLLKSWIESGQLSVTNGKAFEHLWKKYFYCFLSDCVSIPFAIQKENSTQEIITKKIPIKLLAGKIKTEAEWGQVSLTLPSSNIFLLFVLKAT